jgi:hypothetical protein
MDKLEKVCNYKKENITGSSVTINLITEPDNSFVKRVKRNKNINIILDELDEDEYYDILETEQNWESGIMIRKVKIPISNYTNKQDIWKYVSGLLDNLKTDTNLNYKLTGNHSDDERKLIIKMMMASNFIAINSRKGPANFAIVGLNAIEYIDKMIIDDRIGGVEVFVDNLIDPDKIILGRNNNDMQGDGIYLIESNGNFFLKETDRWEKSFISFSIN